MVRLPGEHRIIGVLQRRNMSNKIARNRRADPGSVPRWWGWAPGGLVQLFC